LTASDLRVLNALRLKGLAGEGVLAIATGLDDGEVRRVTAGLEEAGMAVRRTGRMPGWSMTAAGRAAHARAVAAELESSGARDRVDAGYRAILRLNEPFKALCTSWQLRELEPPVVNDHSDPDYDAAAVARLVDIHAEAAPVVDALAGALQRYAPYRPRFDTALARIRSGGLDWFTKPLIGSYHDVWMELHEDLLSTLGIARREGST